MSKENPIKTVGVQPDDFIGHQCSGAQPDITGSERAIKKIINNLGISYKEASLYQDELLEEYDQWELLCLRSDKSEAEKVSIKFMSTYGFTPESLRQAWLDRLKEECCNQ